MIEPSREEITYIAGLLEGEGYFGIQEPYSPTIKLMMTDLDVIEKARTILGGKGNILIKERPNGWKTAYTFNVYGKIALDWMVLIHPYMGKRRQTKIDEIIETYNKRPILGEARTHCRRGHALTEDNFYVDNNNVKQCIICKRDRSNRSYHKKTLEYTLAQQKGITIEEAREIIRKNEGLIQ